MSEQKNNETSKNQEKEDVIETVINETRSADTRVD